MTKRTIKIGPAIVKRLGTARKRTKMVVTASRTAVYILELRSKVARPEWKSRPRANAPKMFEMEEPMTLPSARAERFWLTAAMTTASWRQL